MGCKEINIKKRYDINYDNLVKKNDLIVINTIKNFN